MSNEAPDLRPPLSFKGKWLVIVMVPLIIIISAWLIYLRVTFKRATDTKPAIKGSTAAASSQTTKP